MQNNIETENLLVMILIADSGSTKTHWTLAENGQIIREVFTKGINPFFQTEDDIDQEIRNSLVPQIKDIHLQKIYYYGAGIAFPEKKKILYDCLKRNTKAEVIEIESDLLGAARGLCKNKPGIACILGTGSNSCFYDGTQITQNVSPLGFILGDEGSGAVLGKHLVADVLKNQLSKELSDVFFNRFELTPANILENVYRKPFPNRFLAGLSRFLIENIEHPEIYNIVSVCFESFFKRNVVQYNCKEYKVNFVGSVAYYYSPILMEVAEKMKIRIGEIIQSPMTGLVEYHSIK